MAQPVTCQHFNNECNPEVQESTLRIWPSVSSRILKFGLTPLENPAARSGDDGCSFFNEYGVSCTVCAFPLER
jgi:hypothetical protein